MSDQVEHVLTHHVNVRNPKGEVQTFEPGDSLPKWASDVLLAEKHAAYPVVDKRSLALVKQWQASKLAAEAAAELAEAAAETEA